MTTEDLILELRAVADRLWLLSDRLQNTTQPAPTAAEVVALKARVSTRPGGELSKPRTHAKPETMAAWMSRIEKDLGFKAG